MIDTYIAKSTSSNIEFDGTTDGTQILFMETQVASYPSQCGHFPIGPRTFSFHSCLFY